MSNTPSFSAGMPVQTCRMEFDGRLVELLRRVVALFFIVVAITIPVWSAGEDAIAVIYPDIGEPYRNIFDEIIKGIEDKVGTQVSSYPVSADTDIVALKDRLLHQNAKVVIALGRQGMKTATTLNDGAVVVGSVLTVPESDAKPQNQKLTK